jgi:hypothetical protein
MNNGNGKNNGSNGNGTSSNARQVEEAHLVWQSLQKQIKHLAEKIIRFNSIYTIEDYINEAYLACYDAICRYDSYVKKKKKEHAVDKKAIGWSKEVLGEPGSRSPLPFQITPIENSTQMINKTIMKIEVFAFWYILKRFFKLADMDEVVFNVFNEDEEYIETLSNSEYRKKKKELKSKKCIIRTSNIYRSLDRFNSDVDEDNAQEFADLSFMGFSEDVRLMLEEDISKYKLEVAV